MNTKDEYKSLINPNTVWQTQRAISDDEAIYACRLMLQSINSGEGMNWEKDTRGHLREARRRNSQAHVFSL